MTYFRKVSIVVPFYNGSCATVARAMAATQQDYINYELIYVLYDLPDFFNELKEHVASSRMAASIINMHRIREFQMYSTLKNLGVAGSTGEIVVILDPGSTLPRDFVSLGASWLHKCDILISPQMRTGADKFFAENFFFKRWVYSRIGGFDASYDNYRAISVYDFLVRAQLHANVSVREYHLNLTSEYTGVLKNCIWQDKSKRGRVSQDNKFPPYETYRSTICD